MKRLFTVIVALSLLNVVTCYGQDRVNRVKLSFINEGTTLNNITGWAYDNATGEWIDCVNLLESRKQYKKFAKDPSWMSRNFNNIISLQFKTIIFNDVPYYVLVWDKWTGEYRYPTIMEDWEYWNTRLFLMFTEKDMKKLRNLTNKPITISVPAPQRSRFSKEIEDVDIIQTSMDNNLYRKVSIKIYRATDGTIRFNFKINNIFISSDIDKQYFEMSETDYNNLIKVEF